MAQRTPLCWSRSTTSPASGRKGLPKQAKPAKRKSTSQAWRTTCSSPSNAAAGGASLHARASTLKPCPPSSAARAAKSDGASRSKGAKASGEPLVKTTSLAPAPPAPPGPAPDGDGGNDAKTLIRRNDGEKAKVRRTWPSAEPFKPSTAATSTGSPNQRPPEASSQVKSWQRPKMDFVGKSCATSKGTRSPDPNSTTPRASKRSVVSVPVLSNKQVETEPASRTRKGSPHTMSLVFNVCIVRCTA
mmetsp:Transcript_167482/g.537836  ORF Transcript_167482/g.537836 Transcript_167482/m.537836 type:complete len:245 (-) Transcript_167482:1645-2379(-)